MAENFSLLKELLSVEHNLLAFAAAPNIPKCGFERENRGFPPTTARGTRTSENDPLPGQASPGIMEVFCLPLGIEQGSLEGAEGKAA